MFGRLGPILVYSHSNGVDPNPNVDVLLSMTGYGEARLQDERWSVGVEVRTVNNRHLKLSAKISEPYAALEPELERSSAKRSGGGRSSFSSGSIGRAGPRITG